MRILGRVIALIKAATIYELVASLSHRRYLSKASKFSAGPQIRPYTATSINVRKDHLDIWMFVITVISLAATIIVATFQVGIASSLRELTESANQQEMESKDLDVVSSVSVSMKNGQITFTNEGPTTIANAGYWGVQTSEDVYTDYLSKTTPLPGCSSMTFDISELPKRPDSLRSVVFIFQVPSKKWWTVSDIGLVEESNSQDSVWSEAIQKMASYQLQGDTVMGGFSEFDEQIVNGSTGPIPDMGAYISPDGFQGINARIVKIPCA